jgi:abhydrolase domain-containing protein 11
MICNGDDKNCKLSKRAKMHSHSHKRMNQVLSCSVFNGNSSLTPMIMLHGLFGNKNIWRPLLNTIQPTTEELKRTTYLVDVRNHGQSFHSPEMTYEAMANDLSTLIEHYHLNKVILLGHSMGGKIIMNMLLQQQQQQQQQYKFEIEKCIIADIAPVSYLSDSRWMIPQLVTAMNQLPLNFTPEYNNRKHVDQFLIDRNIKDARVRMLINLNLNRKKDNTGWEWNVNLPAIHSNIHNIGGFPTVTNSDKYEGKILFARGGSSFYCYSEYEQEIDRLFSNYKIETIPNAGHWVHSDSPNEFSRVINNFLIN